MDENTLIDAWNSHDVGAIKDLYADDATRHHYAHPGAHLVGRDATAAGVAAILHACPDVSLTNRSRHVADDGRITMEWRFTGTLENDYGPLPGNGGRVVLDGISVVALNRDGLIQEEHVYWDNATLMVAAGLLGEPGTR